MVYILNTNVKNVCEGMASIDGCEGGGSGGSSDHVEIDFDRYRPIEPVRPLSDDLNEVDLHPDEKITDPNEIIPVGSSREGAEGSTASD